MRAGVLLDTYGPVVLHPDGVEGMAEMLQLCFMAVGAIYRRRTLGFHRRNRGGVWWLGWTVYCLPQSQLPLGKRFNDKLRLAALLRLLLTVRCVLLRTVYL